MPTLSVSVEGECGLTWPRWKRLVTTVEQFGFAALFCADHFTVPEPIAPDSLEMVVALSYLADHTHQIAFGPLVAPLSFRDPVMLTRQAMALDDLSSGRMILGVGAGWMEREHAMFGYQLGDVPTRMARLEEGLDVITRLLQRDEPVSYTGRFYQLHEAVLHPQPQRHGGPPILIGGSGPKRTLPLVARYAQIWNAIGLAPNAFLERAAQLDELLRTAGRQPGDVKRTVLTPVYCARDDIELERRLRWMRLFPECTTLALDSLVETVRVWFNTVILGSPDHVIEQIQAYGAAGVAEVMVQWFGLDDVEGLQILAEQVMPYL